MVGLFKIKTMLFLGLASFLVLTSLLKVNLKFNGWLFLVYSIFSLKPQICNRFLPKGHREFLRLCRIHFWQMDKVV